MMKSASLRLQLEDLKRDMSSKNEENCVALNGLKSENDLLKYQLKKYVGAVQSLKRNDIMEEENERLSSIILSPESDVDEVRKEGNKDFERKLIQVADMHGELIELNERLQKMLNAREYQLRILKEELVNLRGPLPQDNNHDECLYLTEFGPNFMSVNTRPLINIWIPSVFVQGKSPNIHHSYQVYIRIKDDGWNVYKRYSDFYALHKKTSKQFKPVAQFTFPAKKIIGNRDVNFVETRRKQLGNYLRKLINYSLGAVPELGKLQRYHLFQRRQRQNKLFLLHIMVYR
ncbi:sorting nexin-29-like isoform X2 [Xenia sp. Carnegie-2017]|uniref:sorting nexin-29-like isoform X2 n=1 Tax=Xenia sp. Carnegie-2017 TaxID=2897299 RepID=UPI001F04A036|nr:sorting nexin-29-like isoform X2 [Xenia sp. Carnegie-2017]